MLISQNLDTASIELSCILLEEGVKRKTRGFDCIEIPHPVMVCIENPHNRYTTIKGRKASKTLPFGESLALLSGINDIDLYADYVPDMVKYSDDGVTQRAGYGPRIRGFLGVSGDYENFIPPYIDGSNKNKAEPVCIDQFKYVVQLLTKDPSSRQAVISITDPANDQFELDKENNLKETVDIPCCRLLQFMIVDGALNCTAYFRSNDLLFGLQQVNVFNNTFIQECLACILGIPVGKYYHLANNLHFYEDKINLVENNAGNSIENYSKEFDWNGYKSKFTLKEFDDLLWLLLEYREGLKNDDIKEHFVFDNDLFDDWAKVFYRFHTGDKSINFVNPYINRLFARPTYVRETKWVKVLQDGVWVFYEVYKPKAYLETCKKEGKKAIYCGEVDKYGYLNK